jgi:hypothetical protein
MKNRQSLVIVVVMVLLALWIAMDHSSSTQRRTRIIQHHCQSIAHCWNDVKNIK